MTTRDGWATPDEAARAAQDWNTQVLECRTYGHTWHGRSAVYVKKWRYYKVTQECPRCGTLRHQELSQAGVVYASWYSYMEGYLSTGIGRIAGEAKGQLRVATLQRGEVETVVGAVRQAKPASSLTRHALGIPDVGVVAS